jgi:hypothetical protein
MKRAFWSPILSAALVVACISVQGQSNVYSLAIYSAGHSWADLCSLSLPFPPYQYKLTERSWCEDANGLTIMDIGNKKAKCGVLRRMLEVQCGSNSFSVSLDSRPLKGEGSNLGPPGTKGSGDLARLVAQCVTNRGGQVTATVQAAMPVGWVLHSREIQDLIVVDGDHFTEVQRLLEHTCGAPDSTLHSAAPVGNGRSLTYTPQQLGVLLNVTGDSRQTVVSVIGRRKP